MTQEIKSQNANVNVEEVMNCTKTELTIEEIRSKVNTLLAYIFNRSNLAKEGKAEKFTDQEISTLMNKIKQLTKGLSRNLIFVMQSKGGVGKSAFNYAFNCIAKMNNWIINNFDLDEESASSSRWLGFAKVTQMSLLNANKNDIDRTKMDNVFKSSYSPDNFYEVTVFDFGAESSRHAAVYFENPQIQKVLKMMSKMLNIHIFCIMGGDNIYPDCKQYASRLLSSTKDIAKIHLVKNLRYNYSDKQNEDLKQLAQSVNGTITEFSLIDEQGTEVSQQIQDEMDNGRNVMDMEDIFTQMRFEGELEKIELNLDL